MLERRAVKVACAVLRGGGGDTALLPGNAMADAMPEFDITRKSRPEVVTSYQPHWVGKFTQIARQIRDLVGHAAIRIDHISSTAIPGLGA